MSHFGELLFSSGSWRKWWIFSYRSVFWMRAVHKYPKGMRLKVVSYLPIQLSALFCGEFGKISTQPHPTLCIQFLDREAITKTIHCHWENRFVLQIVWGYAEILPVLHLLLVVTHQSYSFGFDFCSKWFRISESGECVCVHMLGRGRVGVQSWISMIFTWAGLYCYSTLCIKRKVFIQ